jgi:transposase
MGGFRGRLWTKIRVFVKTVCGRSRYNVLGAADFVTKKVTAVTNDSYITAVQVVGLMKKLLVEYPGETVKIVLDNAGYQQCKTVRMFARLHGIELVFLPAYSPNLNPIERLWKFVKSEVLNAAYHGSFDMFKNAIDSCISKTGTEYLSRISSLISENIQSFCGVRILESL